MSVLETNVFCPRGRHSAGSRMGISQLPSHFPSGALSEQPCSAQLERAGNTSGAAGGPRAPWLGGGGQGWPSRSVEGRGLLKGCLVP